MSESLMNRERQHAWLRYLWRDKTLSQAAKMRGTSIVMLMDETSIGSTGSYEVIEWCVSATSTGQTHRYLRELKDHGCISRTWQQDPKTGRRKSVYWLVDVMLWSAEAKRDAAQVSA